MLLEIPMDISRTACRLIAIFREFCFVMGYTKMTIGDQLKERFDAVSTTSISTVSMGHYVKAEKGNYVRSSIVQFLLDNYSRGSFNGFWFSTTTYSPATVIVGLMAITLHYVI